MRKSQQILFRRLLGLFFGYVVYTYNLNLSMNVCGIRKIFPFALVNATYNLFKVEGANR